MDVFPNLAVAVVTNRQDTTSTTHRQCTSKHDRHHLSVRRKSESVREGFCCRRRSGCSQVARSDSYVARLHSKMLQFCGRILGGASSEPGWLCADRSFNAGNGWK